MDETERTALLTKHSIRRFEPSYWGYGFFKKCSLDKKRQVVEFVFGNGIIYEIAVSYLLALRPPPDIAFVNGKWRQNLRWEHGNPIIKPVSPPKKVRTRIAEKVGRTKRQKNDSLFEGRNEGLRIYFNDGTAFELWCTHVLDLCEPNWPYFWPDDETRLNRWLSQRKKLVVPKFSLVDPDDPFWGYFHKCSLISGGTSVAITMAGTDRHAGDGYLLNIVDLQRKYHLLNKREAIDRKDKSLTIRNLRNSRKDKVLKLWLSNGNRITLNSHDVLSLCDYRYENYLFS